MRLDDDIEAACEAVGARETSNSFEFPVKLTEAFWLCAQGGMTLAEFTWKAKECVTEAAKTHQGQKKLAAKRLDISPQTLWNIEQGHHK